MSLTTLPELKAHLSWLDDLGTVDDALMQGLLDAAEGHIGNLCGFELAATYGTAGKPPFPAALRQAVLMLAAAWYENRETLAEGARGEIPFGVSEIVREFRGWTF